MRELLKENGNKEEIIKRQQEAIDKAIEYIEHCPEYLWANVNTKELLNILQNGSDDNGNN